jgi:hypothetical protein
VIAKNACGFAFLFTGFAIIEMEEKIERRSQAEREVTEAIQFRCERFRSPKTALPDLFTLAGWCPYHIYIQ